MKRAIRVLLGILLLVVLAVSVYALGKGEALGRSQ